MKIEKMVKPEGKKCYYCDEQPKWAAYRSYFGDYMLVCDKHKGRVTGKRDTSWLHEAPGAEIKVFKANVIDTKGKCFEVKVEAQNKQGAMARAYAMDGVRSVDDAWEVA